MKLCTASTTTRTPANVAFYCSTTSSPSATMSTHLRQAMERDPILASHRRSGICCCPVQANRSLRDSDQRKACINAWVQSLVGDKPLQARATCTHEAIHVCTGLEIQGSELAWLEVIPAHSQEHIIIKARNKMTRGRR